jgi:hypothetical protein
VRHLAVDHAGGGHDPVAQDIRDGLHLLQRHLHPLGSRGILDKLEGGPAVRAARTQHLDDLHGLASFHKKLLSELKRTPTITNAIARKPANNPSSGHLTTGAGQHPRESAVTLEGDIGANRHFLIDQHLGDGEDTTASE